MWFEVMVGGFLALALWHYRHGALGLAIVAAGLLTIVAVVGTVVGVAWWWVGPRGLLLGVAMMAAAYYAERQKSKAPIADEHPSPLPLEDSPPPDVQELAERIRRVMADVERLSPQQTEELKAMTAGLFADSRMGDRTTPTSAG